MQQAAGDPANPKLALALAWLRTHQNPECGCWEAVSMNEQYEPGSIPTKFMTDAATSYAVLTLLARRKMRPPPFLLRIDRIGRNAMKFVVVTVLAGT